MKETSITTLVVEATRCNEHELNFSPTGIRANLSWVNSNRVISVILHYVRVNGYQNIEFPNPEFKILKGKKLQYEILKGLSPEFKFLEGQNPEFKISQRAKS